MEDGSRKVYLKALSETFGSTSMAENWLNKNSQRLNGKTSRGNTIRKREAKQELWAILSKQT